MGRASPSRDKIVIFLNCFGAWTGNDMDFGDEGGYRGHSNFHMKPITRLIPSCQFPEIQIMFFNMLFSVMVDFQQKYEESCHNKCQEMFHKLCCAPPWRRRPIVLGTSIRR